ncbi:MAG: class I SAM-dependent methyltransferase [Myxococcota bacterium]|nr:class I SAM-dependent methyltransferase [Myxococcota bacterium]
MAHIPSPNRVRRDPTLAREAYYRALEARNPNESQRSWRRKRFELGLRLASELERVHISTVENLEILDMGMGFGGDCSSLTSQGAHMTGLDSIDLGMKPLRDAFRDLASIRTVRAELNSPLPFSDGSFDGILSIDSLEHVRDLELFFGECGRVLRPWGWIIVATPLAFRRIYHDGHFELPGISLLPMKTRLFVAKRVFGRRYPYTLANRTLYSIRGLSRPARRHGFMCRGMIFSDREFPKTFGRIPGGRLALWGIRRLAPDYTFFSRS